MGFLDMVPFNKRPENENPEVMELERKLGMLDQQKNDLIFQTGLLYVQNNDVNSAAGTPYEPLLQQISNIEKEKVITNKRILAVQGLRRCEKCDNILPLESAFCNKCGEKLNALFEEEAAPASGTVCVQCGAPLANGAMFCAACGAKQG